jgi:hypothetical protein
VARSYEGAPTVGYLDLTGANEAEAVEWACYHHPGVFAERKLGYVNEPFHWEWYELTHLPRTAVCAPREHAKSEVFSIVTTAHHAIYRPGSWQYLFSATMDQSVDLLERCLSAIAQTEPWLLDNPPRLQRRDVVLGNWSRITVASVGKAIRGVHPDRIVGDDVLKDENTTNNLARARLHAWWFGTVGPMAHPGSRRPMRWGRLAPRGTIPVILHPPTKINLVGTPFHQLDLLMQMRENPIYTFRRYTAQFTPEELVAGTLAVEATGYLRAA